MPSGTTSKYPEDEALLAAVRHPQSAERAFAELVQAHQEPLYWHIRRMVSRHDDADDLLQTTFIKAWKNIQRFRGDSKLRTWLFRIATNECLTFLSREKKRQHTDLRDIQDNLSHSTTGNDSLSGDEIEARLLVAVEALPDKQKLVFNLKYFDDMKYTEIQEITGGSIGSLKASFHHAVKKVEQFLTAR